MKNLRAGLTLLAFLLLEGCANCLILPNGETISRDDFSKKNFPHFVYKETKEEILEVCRITDVACYKPSQETVYMREGLENSKEVWLHEWAHHVIYQKYPENLLLSRERQEELVHQLLGTI